MKPTQLAQRTASLTPASEVRSVFKAPPSGDLSLSAQKKSRPTRFGSAGSSVSLPSSQVSPENRRSETQSSTPHDSPKRSGVSDDPISDISIPYSRAVWSSKEPGNRAKVFHEGTGTPVGARPSAALDARLPGGHVTRGATSSACCLSSWSLMQFARTFGQESQQSRQLQDGLDERAWALLEWKLPELQALSQTG